MKNIITVFTAVLLFANTARSQNFILHIRNNAHTDLTYALQIDHGLTGLLPDVFAHGQTKDIYFNPNVLTGVEGLVSVYPPNQPQTRAQVYYNNPLIGTATYSTWSYALVCKPQKWQVLPNKGGDGELWVEITNPGSGYGKAIPVSFNGTAVIKGSILWDKNEIQSPVAAPYGNAFGFKVYAPAEFIESNGPFTLEKTGSYNGKNGYFQGRKETGTVSYETVASNNPNYVEIRYSITNVPTGIPLEMDVVTDMGKSAWLAGPGKIKPADDYVFVVGTFPSTSKPTVTIDNNLAQLNNVDFICNGDWMKFDVNNGITGGGAMVNKIAARKSNPVLPGNGMISLTKNETTATQRAMAPAVQSQVQQKQVQQIKSAGAVKIRQ